MTELTLKAKEDYVMEQVASKELSFGCKFVCLYSTEIPSHYEDLSYWKIIEYDSEYNMVSSFIFHPWEDERITKDIDKLQIKEIIGHPIYPHHLLLRGRKNKIAIWFSKYWDQINAECTSKKEYIMIPRDLSKDFLSQSPETKEAIYELVLSVNKE